MYLGLDVGTSVIKAALFDDQGQEIGEASQRMSLLQAPLGWSELDGNALWQAAQTVIRNVIAKGTGSASDIRGVGVTGVMVGAWLIDDHGDLIRPPILWNDARAQSLIEKIRSREPDLFEKVFSLSGSVMQLGCTLPVIAWLQEHEPKNLARATQILCAKDYVRYQLTGEFATDESESAMAPGSAVDRSFHPEQARLLGIEAHLPLLAPVKRAETLAGAVTRKASELTGLVEGTPVAVGTGDTGSCVLGAGGHEAGQAITVLGTTCLNGVLFDTPVFEPRNQGLLFIVPGQKWMKTMVNVAGTTVLDWALRSLCPDIADQPQPYETLGELAMQAPAGCNGAVFVPYLSASGVIAPRIEPNARAGFMGLAPHHDRAAMVRAIYEGMAYAIRDCYEAIGNTGTSIRLSGGGARSAFWAQMIADVTSKRVEVPQGTQFGAKGAALCAAVAIGDFKTIGEACAATFSAKAIYEPRTEDKAAYEAGFTRFKVGSEQSLGNLTAIAVER